MNKKVKIGLIGETYIMYKLAQVGLYSQKQNPFFGYDILVENGARLEVKTSSVRIDKGKENSKEGYEREHWNFFDENNEHEFDFYVLVCLNENERPEKVFVVPRKEVEGRKLLSIPRVYKRTGHESSLSEYEGKLDLIFKYKMGPAMEKELSEEFIREAREAMKKL